MTGVRTVTLTGFLLARIAEDEREARQVNGARWRYDDRAGHLETGSDVGYWTPDGEHAFRCDDDLDGCSAYRWAALLDAEHMVRWEPARVLAECAAKRRIVALHETDTTPGVGGIPRPYCRECGSDEYPGPFPCPTLCLLALPYASHPDYDDEWKP